MINNYKTVFVILLILTFPLFDVGYKVFLSDNSSEVSFLYSQEESGEKKIEVKKTISDDMIYSSINSISFISNDAHYSFIPAIYNYRNNLSLLRPPIHA